MADQPYPGTGVVDAADLETMGAVERDTSPLLELGVTGLKRVGGYVDEEFLPQLKGRKAVQVFREMGDNDPIVGAMLFSIVQLVGNVDFPVVPAGKSREAANGAKLVETAMDDMSHSWDHMVAEIVQGKLQYGWQWNEIVYKRRNGPWQNDGRLRSRYSDGMWGWRKLPVRAQETLLRWVFDDNGGIAGMIQLAPPDYQTRYLPIGRSMLFRYGVHKNNPEGRSLLRAAYRPWFYKKRLEEFESVGVERDLAGLPIVKLPTSYLRAPAGSPQYKMAQSLQKLVRNVRRNETEGLLFPREFDDDSRQEKFTFELLGSGGARQFSTNELIQRYEQRILMTCLADFIMVGHTQTGTYNLHVDKTGIFRTALNKIAQEIADVFNRHAIPRLFARNGWRPAELPQIVPTDVDVPDLGQLAAFLQATAGVGINWAPDADNENFFRRIAGMPELDRDDESRHRRMQRMAESARLAQTQTEAIASRSQLAQAIAAEKMTLSGEPTVEHAQAIAGARGQAAAADQQAVDEDRNAARFDTEQDQAKLTQAQGWQQLLTPDQQQGPAGGGRR